MKTTADRYEEHCASVLSRLQQVRKAGGTWKARCPAHDDHDASLGISIGDFGRVRLTCGAGCKEDRIASALGLRIVDLAPQPPQSNVIQLGSAQPAYKLLPQMVSECFRPIGPRLLTGLPTIDLATRGGIPMGRVVGLLGAPGVGKTTLEVQLMLGFERQGCACVWLAADEPAEGIITRIGQLLGHSRDVLEAGDEAGAAARALLALQCSEHIAIKDPDADESLGCTIEDAARVAEHMAPNGPRALFIDSIHTAQCAAANGLSSPRERIEAKVLAIKAIAARGTTVIFTGEMARGAYRTGDKNIDTSALSAGKESGSIEYGVSLLLSLRSVKGEHDVVEVEVAKNRIGGVRPEFRMRLDAEHARFVEVAVPGPEERRQQAEDAKATKACRRVVEAVKRKELRTKDELCVEARGRRADVWREASRMLATGELQQVDGVFRLSGGGTNA